MGALEEVACAICGPGEIDVIQDARPRPAPIDLPGMFSASSTSPLVDRLVRCRSCDLVFVSPRIARSEIIDAYRAGTDERFVSQNHLREATFARTLDLIEATVGKPGRVFDVGAAGGSFLAAAQARGWAIDGCEPNAWLASRAQACYRIRLRSGTLDEQHLSPASYDVVTLWDVLEHVTDPASTLRAARELLGPGGSLFLTFPDVGSFSARVMGRRWPGFRAAHLYYFSAVTLGRLLRKEGFVVTFARPHTQRLELGYMLNRATGGLFPWRWRLPVAYRLGQTLAAARRVE